MVKSSRRLILGYWGWEHCENSDTCRSLKRDEWLMHLKMGVTLECLGIVVKAQAILSIGKLQSAEA